MKHAIVGFAALTALVAAPRLAAANVVFTDQTFTLANYTPTPTYTSGGATGSYTQCASCGNPGQALQFSATFGNGAEEYAQGLVNTGFLYNPTTQGPVYSISASVDKDFTSPYTGTFGNSFRPLIAQGGNYYIDVIPGPALNGPGTTNYNTISASGLTASSFTLFDFTTGTTGTGNPNFSAPFSLGLAQVRTTNFSGVTNPSPETFDYDNLSFTIVNTIPEPATLPILATALACLGGLGACRLRRR